MSVYLVRHADKEEGEHYGPELRLNDQNLSEAGRAQALRLLDCFDGIGIDTIRASRYRRTSQTASFLAHERGIGIRVDPRLDEIDIGELDRLKDDEIRVRYPDFWRAYTERTADFRFPGGESGEEAGARIHEAFLELDLEGNHLLVAHDGIIRALLCRVLGLPAHRRHLFRIGLCSVTRLEYQSDFGSWAIAEMNGTAHLRERCGPGAASTRREWETWLKTGGMLDD